MVFFLFLFLADQLLDAFSFISQIVDRMSLWQSDRQEHVCVSPAGCCFNETDVLQLCSL